MEFVINVTFNLKHFTFTTLIIVKTLPVAKLTPRKAFDAVVIPVDKAPWPEISPSPNAAITLISAGLRRCLREKCV